MKPRNVDSTLRALAERARDQDAEPTEPSDGEGRALLEALGSAAHKRALDLALGELCDEPKAVPVPAPANDGARAPSRGRLGALLTAVALAAGLALFFVGRGGRDAPLAAVPSYELTITGGAAETRGDPSATPVLTPGSRVALMLRPGTKVDGSVEARAWLVQGGRARALSLEAAVTPEGAVRLSGPVGALPEPVGPAELVVTIVRPGTAHEPLGGSTPTAQVVRRPVVVAKDGE